MRLTLGLAGRGRGDWGDNERRRPWAGARNSARTQCPILPRLAPIPAHDLFSSLIRLGFLAARFTYAGRALAAKCLFQHFIAVWQRKNNMEITRTFFFWIGDEEMKRNLEVPIFFLFRANLKMVSTGPGTSPIKFA